MQRITAKMLQYQVDHLNKITNSPDKAWTDNGAAIGNYHISHAYGGVCLHQNVNAGGGVRCPLSQGHGPKRELYDALRAFISGIELGANNE